MRTPLLYKKRIKREIGTGYLFDEFLISFSPGRQTIQAENREGKAYS